VPDTSTVSLSDGAVKMRVTMLYADLADSTELASTQDARAVARIYKSFLACCSRLIGENGGQIRSFDGDRVMGVFVGSTKNTSAAKCALQINYVFTQIIKPKRGPSTRGWQTKKDI
jgi:class 3 adenylate cyclase